MAVPQSLVAYVVRISGKLELLLDETIAVLQAVRPALPAVASAIEQGLLDDVRDALPQLVSSLRVVDTLPQTQADVRVAVETLQSLVGLTNITLAQLEAIPGAKLLRRRISRALNDQQLALLETGPTGPDLLPAPRS